MISRMKKVVILYYCPSFFYIFFRVSSVDHQTPTSATSRDTMEPGVAPLPRLVIIGVTVIGTALLILNIVLISCFFRRRRKRLNSKSQFSYLSLFFIILVISDAPELGERERMITEVLRGKGSLPQIVIIIVSIVGVCLLVLNVCLIACFIRRRRKKRLESEGKIASFFRHFIRKNFPNYYINPYLHELFDFGAKIPVFQTF